VVSGEMTHEEILRAVCVLVLIDHHVAELLRVTLAYGGRVLEELDGFEQQVIEIEGVGFP
jgi:hypothetical protein